MRTTQGVSSVASVLYKRHWIYNDVRIIRSSNLVAHVNSEHTILGMYFLDINDGGITLNQQRPTYCFFVKKQELALRGSTSINYLSQFDILPMRLTVSLPKIKEFDI